MRWPRRQRRASCREVAKVLQLYLDGQTDPTTTARVRQHLDGCRRCGMDHDVYLALKRSLRRRAELDGDTVTRLRAFGDRLVVGWSGRGGRAVVNCTTPLAEAVVLTTLTAAILRPWPRPR